MAKQYRDLTYGEAFASGDQMEDTVTRRWVGIPSIWLTNKAVYTKEGTLGTQHIRVRKVVSE